MRVVVKEGDGYVKCGLARRYEDDIEKVTEECGMKKEFYLKELNLS